MFGRITKDLVQVVCRGELGVRAAPVHLKTRGPQGEQLERSPHTHKGEAAFPEALSLPAHSQQAGSEQPHLTPTPAWAKHPRELWVLPFGFALWFYHLEVRVCDMYAHLFLTSRLGYQHRMSCMTHFLPFSGIAQESLELFLLKCLLEGTG